LELIPITLENKQIINNFKDINQLNNKNNQKKTN